MEKNPSIIPNKVDRKRIENYQNNSDAAFIEMARKIDRENGGRKTYALIGDGVYQLY
jgi:hypothetical protein